MATKKSNSAAKKSTLKTSTSVKPATTTKVTTVKAVESRPASRKVAFLSAGRMPLIGAALAEFIGTFLLAYVYVTTQEQPLYLLFSLAGLTLLVAGLSGAHINPAVTVGAWVTRRISGLRALAYIVAQILGAMLALVVLHSFVNAAPAVSDQARMLGQSAATLFTASPLPTGKEWFVLFAELLGATIVAFAFARARRASLDTLSKALLIGSGLFLGLIIANSAAVSVGGSAILNPAVAITLQAFSKLSLWTAVVYAVMPLIGGVIGFALNDLLDKSAAEADATPVVR